MRVHTKSLKLIFFSSSANKPSIVTSHSLPTASQLTFESLFSNNRYRISYTDSINWLPTKATLNAFNNYCFWHVGTKLNLISDVHSIWSQTHKKFFRHWFYWIDILIKKNILFFEWKPYDDIILSFEWTWKGFQKIVTKKFFLFIENFVCKYFHPILLFVWLHAKTFFTP